ncbi:hypothetical protein EG834_07765, partial [bacterium]|nr:hypothetical protein [bacterium]
MPFSKITVDQVESFLRTSRGVKVDTDGLVSVDALFDPLIEAREERAILLADRLERLVLDSYFNSRRQETLSEQQPTEKPRVVLQIQQDFSRGNSDLEAWSALCFRYFSPVSLTVEDLAQAASVVPQQFRRRLNHGLEMLVKKLHREVLENLRNPVNIERNLPLPDATRLVEVGASLNLLSALFLDPAGPRMVSLEGIGGIGKTALARAFVAQPDLSANWPEILWVSARQSLLAEDGSLMAVPDSVTTLEDITIRMAEQLGLAGLTGKPLSERLEGLHLALGNKKTLTIIDNIETAEEIHALVPALAKMAGASRFLITTRQTLRAYPYIHIIPLSELSADGAYNLLSGELIRRGRTVRATAKDFDDLYQVVGGIPLAIKLAAAQLSLLPLHQIVTNLRQASMGTDQMYHYLYWQTWQALHEPARFLQRSF